ncbi:MAG TPA: RnfABCDGE type electron transport complex subunit G [bacterium]
MKEIIKLGLILLLVTAIAGAALSVVNNITKPEIEKRKIQATAEALTTALPAAANGVIEPVIKADTIRYYLGYRDSLKLQFVGYAFLAKENGYSSEIETMIGVDTTGTIVGIKILRQLETPGLGTKIEEVRYGQISPYFQTQFIDKVAGQLAVDKDGGQIVSITGATISSRATTNSIKKGIQKLEQEIGGFKK